MNTFQEPENKSFANLRNATNTTEHNIYDAKVEKEVVLKSLYKEFSEEPWSESHYLVTHIIVHFYGKKSESFGT